MKKCIFVSEHVFPLNPELCNSSRVDSFHYFTVNCWLQLVGVSLNPSMDQDLSKNVTIAIKGLMLLFSPGVALSNQLSADNFETTVL